MASHNPLARLLEAAQAGDINTIETLCKESDANLNLLAEGEMHVRDVPPVPNLALQSVHTRGVIEFVEDLY